MWKRGFKKADMTSAYKPMVLGIAGLSHSCHPLHFSIALAVFIDAFFEKRVAILEWGDGDDFENIKRAFESENRRKEGAGEYFSVDGIDFYPRVGVGEFMQIKEVGYTCILINFGSCLEASRIELSRCDLCYILVNLVPWRVREFFKYIHIEEDSVLEKRTHIYTFGEEDIEKRILRRYKLPLLHLPFIPNPFVLEQQSFVFFREHFKHLW